MDNNYKKCEGICKNKVDKNCLNFINESEFENFKSKHKGKYYCDYCTNEYKILYKIK